MPLTLRRISFLGVSVAAVLASCAQPICSCSEAGSRLVLYGVTTLEGSATALTDVEIGVALGDLDAVTDACVYPGRNALDAPPAVRSDGAGRYRIEILTVARFTQCVTVTAERASPAPLLGGVVDDVMVTFGPPGTTDSLELAIALAPL